MPNLAQVLKVEILRLASKVAREQTSQIKADAVRLKKANVILRKDVAQLKRDNSLLMASEKRRQENAPVIAPDKADKARITAKGIRSLRKHLGLSQGDFGKLVGVTPGAVKIWERKEGALRLRDKTRTGILALRGLGAREAKRRLELLAKKTAVKKAVGK